ncbi:hypothetical protein [Lacrimispora brassicae]
MMKSIKFLLCIIGITLGISTTAFAGQWQQDNIGWYYQNDDGSYVINDWLTLSDTEKYHFDENGYMQTGVIEVNELKYYLYEDGRLTYNWNTPEGYRVDYTGRIIEDDTPGLTFLFIAGTDNPQLDHLIVCMFRNESNQEFTVDPIIEVNTNGLVKQFSMVDIYTLTPCDYGQVQTNETQYFSFIAQDLQNFSFNDNTRITAKIRYNSNSYEESLVLIKLYRFHFE